MKNSTQNPAASGSELRIQDPTALYMPCMARGVPSCRGFRLLWSRSGSGGPSVYQHPMTVIMLTCGICKQGHSPQVELLRWGLSTSALAEEVMHCPGVRLKCKVDPLCKGLMHTS